MLRLTTIHRHSPAYDDVERQSMYQKVQYFIWSKNVAWVLAEWNILCNVQVNAYYSVQKNTEQKHFLR